MLKQLPNYIPSPPWWQLINWIADPIGFQDKYCRKYGDIFTMSLSGLGDYVIIGNPPAIKEIFNQDSKFDMGRGNELAQPLVGRNSIMLMDGNRHQRERKLLMPPFHGERLKDYAAQICQITEQIIHQWDIGKNFVARTTMQQISLEVILQIVFGICEGNRYQQIRVRLTEWLNLTDSPLRSSILFFQFLQQDWGTWTPWGRMKQRQQQIHNLLQQEIEDRRTHGVEEGNDILSLMMSTRDEHGQAMTDEELRDELLTMLFAGHETTATSLAWALYQVHQHSHIQVKLVQELETLQGDFQPLEMAKLPYLSAVCQETLRMYPVIPVIFPRIARMPVTVAGRQFEAETVFMPSAYLVHYREDLFPQAHQFNPERFLDHQYAPSEYLPFGGGSRRCLGYALAQLEMKLVLGTILSNYRLELAEDKPVRLQRRGFTLAPIGGVKMVMKGKQKHALKAF